MTLDPAQLQDDRITRIENKLDTLMSMVVARHECPAPGSCLGFAPRIERLEVGCIEAANRLNRLERWQSSIMGMVAVVGFIIAPMLIILGPIIREKLGLP
jgi:hypothetical protein